MDLSKCLNWGLNQKFSMNASVSVVCYKSKVLSNGKSPLMLRVTKDRKPKYVSLGIFASILKNTGVNIALISQALGHQDIKTTETVSYTHLTLPTIA